MKFDEITTASKRSLVTTLWVELLRFARNDNFYQFWSNPTVLPKGERLVRKFIVKSTPSGD